jgi:hypothetical protein
MKKVAKTASMIAALFVVVSQSQAASSWLEGGIAGGSSGPNAQLNGGFGGNTSSWGFGGSTQVNVNGFVGGASYGPFSSVSGLTQGTGFANTSFGSSTATVGSGSSITVNGPGSGNAYSNGNATASWGFGIPVPPVIPIPVPPVIPTP